MKAFVRGLLHHHPKLFSDQFGPLTDNYLDDIWFVADSEEKNRLQLLVAEFWANWLGIQLNNDKRELPASATRHLGFFIDLQRKAVMITQKHKRKITVFFDNFLVAARKKERLSIRGGAENAWSADLDQFGFPSGPSVSNFSLRYSEGNGGT